KRSRVMSRRIQQSAERVPDCGVIIHDKNIIAPATRHDPALLLPSSPCGTLAKFAGFSGIIRGGRVAHSRQRCSPPCARPRMTRKTELQTTNPEPSLNAL